MKRRVWLTTVLLLAASTAGADELLYYVEDGSVVFTNTPMRGDVKPVPGLDERVAAIRGKHLPKTPWDEFIRREAERHGVNADLVKAVEALRAWLAREADVDWAPHILLNRDGAREEIERPASRVLEAQWRLLAGLGRVIGGSGPLGAYAARFAKLGRKDSHLALDVAQTNALIAQLGKMVREARRD